MEPLFTNAPGLKRIFSMRVRMSERVDSGEGPLGRRSFNGTGGGVFEGDGLRGAVHAGAADWMMTRRDGVNVIDARVMLITEDGAAIYMNYGGRAIVPAEILPQVRDPARRGDVDPSTYYFRTTPAFETGAPAYAWLNDVVAVGAGRLLPEGLGYDVFQVL
jgi:hypothetical protein